MTRPSPPGAQAERTVLAWTRTTLALFVGVLTVIRLAVRAHLVLAIVTGAIAAPLSLATLWTVSRRYRSRDPVIDARLPGLTAGLTALLGVAGLIDVLLG